MRAIVMSDSHGMGDRLKWLLMDAWRQAGPEPIDFYIHCGDGGEELEDLRQMILQRDPKASLCVVKGNCDFFSDAPLFAVLTIGGLRVFVTHGHMQRVKSGLMNLGYAAEERGCDIALYGHTHQAAMENGRALMVNPGAAMDGRMALLQVTEGKPHVRLLRVE